MHASMCLQNQVTSGLIDQHVDNANSPAAGAPASVAATDWHMWPEVDDVVDNCLLW